jgi:hypothetical protein
MDPRPIEQPTAWLVLSGHPDAPVRVGVIHYSRLARLYRTTWYFVLWIVSTVGMFLVRHWLGVGIASLVTIFDPFMTSMPLFVGAVMTYRSWRGRYRVTEFHGGCPRCGEPIELQPGSKIGTPHHLVCYNCHHEPDLYLAT